MPVLFMLPLVRGPSSLLSSVSIARYLSLIVVIFSATGYSTRCSSKPLPPSLLVFLPLYFPLPPSPLRLLSPPPPPSLLLPSQHRITRRPSEELLAAAQEQQRITELRLRAMLTEGTKGGQPRSGGSATAELTDERGGGEEGDEGPTGGEGGGQQQQQPQRQYEELTPGGQQAGGVRGQAHCTALPCPPL